MELPDLDSERKAAFHKMKEALEDSQKDQMPFDDPLPSTS